MMDKQKMYDFLDKAGINYEKYEHQAAFTVEDMDKLNLPYVEKVAKNFFLRDDKARNYYIVAMPLYKKVDLKTISEKIPSRKLSFANEEKLYEMVGLRRGSVTPLGILNDETKKITMVFDSCLQGQIVGMHPLENTATIFMQFEDLLKIIQEQGAPVVVCDLY